MKVKAKFGNGTVVDVIIQNNPENTVKDLKEMIKSTSGEQQEMRLVYKGRIMQDDEQLLADFNIQEGEVIHVAKVKTTPVQSSTAPLAPVVDPQQEMMANMMNNPMVQNMMSNPEFMRSILQSDPRYQQMAEEHPELREALNDPNILRQIGETARNPRLMQEMMRNQDRAIANIENIPGGFQKMASLFSSIDGVSTAGSDPSTEEANQRMARALGVRSTSTDDGPNSQPLPNPWAPQRTSPSTTPASGLPRSPFNFPMGGFPAFPTAPPNAPLQPQATSTGQSPNMTFFPPLFPFAAPPGNASGAPNGMPPFMMPMVPNSNPNQPMPNNPFMMMQQLMQSGQMNPTPTPTPPTEPVEIRYREQLQCLRDMGFTNEDLNKRAILAAGGNTDAAVEYILNQ